MKPGWTFGIITGGTEPDRVEKIIETIRDNFRQRDDYEITIVGADTNLFIDHVLYLEFDETVKKGWITRKKNIVAETARFDKLCIMHDYVSLSQTWLKGFERFGDDWNVAVNPIYNTNGRLFRFWCVADHDAGVDMGDDREGRVPFRNIRAGLQGLARWQYISGAYFCVKTEVFRKVPLNEDLVWGESEDIEWSRRMFLEYGEDAFACNLNATTIFLKSKPHAPWENLPCL